MANTENVDGAKAPPSPEPEPEPRVTNDAEGGKKQKEAVKKLSDYSKEVMARKTREDAKPAEIAAEPQPEPEPEPEAPGWGISTGNAIAAVGVGVAMVCLYLSYFGKKEKFTVPGPVTVVKAAPPAKKKVAAEPKFRRL